MKEVIYIFWKVFLWYSGFNIVLYRSVEAGVESEFSSRLSIRF